MFYRLRGARGAEHHVLHRVLGARGEGGRGGENQICYRFRGAQRPKTYRFYRVRGARGAENPCFTMSGAPEKSRIFCF